MSNCTLHRSDIVYLYWDPACQAFLKFCYESLSDFFEFVCDKNGEVVKLFNGVLVAHALLFTDLQHGATGTQSEPGTGGGTAIERHIESLANESFEMIHTRKSLYIT